ITTSGLLLLVLGFTPGLVASLLFLDQPWDSIVVFVFEFEVHVATAKMRQQRGDVACLVTKRWKGGACKLLCKEAFSLALEEQSLDHFKTSFMIKMIKGMKASSINDLEKNEGVRKQSMEEEEVSLVDGVFEGAFGALEALEMEALVDAMEEMLCFGGQFTASPIRFDVRREDHHLVKKKWECRIVGNKVVEESLDRW
ncbi:hypothetical protein Tco_0887452, partial [Tanacetum coccineum]